MRGVVEEFGGWGRGGAVISLVRNVTQRRQIVSFKNEMEAF